MLLFNFQGGYTPLHNASLHNHPDTVSVLLQGGADVNIRDDVSILQSWFLYVYFGVVYFMYKVRVSIVFVRASKIQQLGKEVNGCTRKL